MIDPESDFWTSSFKKMISTEDQRNIQFINRILRRAICGPESDKRRDVPVYLEETCNMKNKGSAETPSNNANKTKTQANNIVEMKNKANKPSQEEIEICHAHIYETVPLGRPRIVLVNPSREKTASNGIGTSEGENIATEKTVSKRASILDKEFWEPLSPANEPAEKRKSVESNLYVKKKSPNVDINQKRQEEPPKTSLEAIASCGPKTVAQKLDAYFTDDKGLSPSPIPRCDRPRGIKDKFVVNLFESRCNVADANTKVKKKLNDARLIQICDNSGSENIDTTVNKPLSNNCEQCSGNTSTVTIPLSVLEAMAEIDNLSGLDFKSELEKIAPDSDAEYDKDATYTVENGTAEPIYAVLNKMKGFNQLSRDNSNNDEGFLKLKQEVDVQCKIMKQASKALDVYKAGTKHNFDVLSEVEAQKILITANCKYELLLQELRQGHYESPSSSSNSATVTVKNIQAELQDRQEIEWYLCIVSDEKNVFSTKALKVLPAHRVAIFKEAFTFNDAGADFQVKVELYSFKPETFKRTASFRINKKISKICRKTLLQKDLHSQSLARNEVPKSSFKLQGSVMLRVDDIINKDQKRFLNLSPESGLTGRIHVEAGVDEVKLVATRCGFMNVGLEQGYSITWNRRWCVLNEACLQFWNDPNEEGIKEPLGEVQIQQCIQEVAHARRSLCPRPKTLYMELVDGNRIFMNADGVADMHSWRKQLNDAFGTLKAWKMLHRQQDKWYNKY